MPAKTAFVDFKRMTFLKIAKRVESAKTKSRLRELFNMTKWYSERGKMYYSDVLDINKRIAKKEKLLDH